MQVLKIILMVIAVILVPVVSIFLIRLTFKLGKGLDHINRTIDDARPQLNMLLLNLNQTLEDVNEELDRVGGLTSEAQEMLDRVESGMRTVEETLRSPAARYGGVLAGVITTTFVVRGVLRRGRGRGRREGKGA